MIIFFFSSEDATMGIVDGEIDVATIIRHVTRIFQKRGVSIYNI